MTSAAPSEAPFSAGALGGPDGETAGVELIPRAGEGGRDVSPPSSPARPHSALRRRAFRNKARAAAPPPCPPASPSSQPHRALRTRDPAGLNVNSPVPRLGFSVGRGGNQAPTRPPTVGAQVPPTVSLPVPELRRQAPSQGPRLDPTIDRQGGRGRRNGGIQHHPTPSPSKTWLRMLPPPTPRPRQRSPLTAARPAVTPSLSMPLPASTGA